MKTIQTESFISPWMEDLPFSWDSLFQHGQKIVFKKHDHIFHQDQAAEFVYIVLDGRIRLFLLSPSGDENTIAIIGKNGLLGECGVFGFSSYNSSAITASKATIIKVPKHLFVESIQQNEQLTNQVLNIMTIKNRILSTHTMMLSHFSAVQRICYTLTQLVQTYGVNREKGHLITIGFTHQELANLVGTSRVTVAKTMKSLENQGILLKKESKYLILNVEELATFTID